MNPLLLLLGKKKPFVTVEMPSGLGWNTETYPLTIKTNGTTFITDFVPEAYATAALAGTAYYVDVATGVDTNTGLGSYTNAVKSIWRAVQLGNATGAAYKVYVKAGQYTRETAITDQMLSYKPTQDVAFIADGGRVNVADCNILTWTLDATYTNCYKATRSNCVRVFDLLGGNNADGDYASEFTKVADAATCNSTPNSWAQVSTTVYIHRSDAVAVTDANTRVLVLADVFSTSTSTKSIYIKGFDLEGGNTGVFNDIAGHTGNVIAVDCTFKYSTAGSACFRIDKLNGLAACVNCIASAGMNDGFNIHNAGYAAADTYLLTINCKSVRNGIVSTTTVSNNGLTGHEDAIAIDVNGVYDRSYGGTVHFIGSSKLWCVNTTAQNSYGDLSHGGTINPCEFIAGLNTGDTTQMWLTRCTAIAQSAGNRALYAAISGCTIYNTQPKTIVGTTNEGPGSVVNG